MRGDECPIGLPDLASLDDAECLSPGIEAIWCDRAGVRRRQRGRHACEKRVPERRHVCVGLGESVLQHDQLCDAGALRRSLQQLRADAAEHAGRGGEPAGDVEGGRHLHRPRHVDPAVGRAQAVQPAKCGRHPHRAAGVAAEREVAGASRGGRCRAARRAAGNPARRVRIDRRAVMGVDAGHAEEELVAHRLADDGGSGVQDPADGCGIRRGRRLRGQPVRIAAAAALAGDVVHILDRRGQPGQRAVRGACDRLRDVVRNESRAEGHRRPHWDCGACVRVQAYLREASWGSRSPVDARTPCTGCGRRPLRCCCGEGDVIVELQPE